MRSLKGHGHWVNTLALSTECVLRTGAHDHTGRAPSEPQSAQQVRTRLMLVEKSFPSLTSDINYTCTFQPTAAQHVPCQLNHPWQHFLLEALLFGAMAKFASGSCLYTDKLLSSLDHTGLGPSGHCAVRPACVSKVK